MNKGKIIFVAYENFWERIFLFCSGCYAVVLLLGVLYYWGHFKQLHFWWVYAVLGAVCALLGYTLYFAFKPRIKLYTGGIKIPGYPFFEWKKLKKSRFVFLSEERKPLSPDQELEIIPAKGLVWKTSIWRRLVLRKEFYTRIIAPFWALPVTSRQQLLQELKHFIKVPPYPLLRGDEKMRLFWRRVFFMAADIMSLICLIVLGCVLVGEWLYQNGNIY